MNQNRDQSVFQLLKSLFHSETREVIAVIIYALAVGICSLAIPIAVQALINSVSFATLTQPILILTGLVAGVLSISGLLRLLQISIVEIIQQRLVVRIALYLSKKLPHVIAGDFYKNFGPEYILRFMEVFTVQKVVSLLLLDGIALFFQVLFGLILVSFYHPFFLIFAILTTLLILIIVVLLGINGISTSIKESTAKYNILTWLQDITIDMTVFKSYYGERYAIKKTDQLICQYIHDRNKHFSILLRQNAASVIIQTIVNSALLLMGGLLVMKQELTLGQLVSAELIFSSVLLTLTKIGKHLEKFYDLVASLTKLNDLKSLPFEDSPAGRQFPSLIEDNVGAAGITVQLKNITFHSPNFSDPLFEKISLLIAAKSRIGIWAHNSAGKSVLADILYRIRAPKSGWVEIDGLNINELSTYSLRSKILLIRDIEFFHGPLIDNLTLGKDVPRQKIREISRQLGILDFIESLSDGLDTIIKGHQNEFSRGQSIRLMIARGILLEPGLLIIDGTLDALDSYSLENVCDFLASKEHKFSLLILSHNVEYIKSLEEKYKFTQDGLEVI